MNLVTPLSIALATTPPEPPWLWPHYLPAEGTIILDGAPKAGKTTLAAQVAGAMALSIPQCRVLFIQLDTPPSLWLTLLRRVLTKPTDQFYVINPILPLYNVNILSPKWSTMLKDAVAECDPHVVIIDCLSELHEFDENESFRMKPVIGALRVLSRGRLLLLLHHATKGTPGIPQDPVRAVRGSSYIAGACDGVWALQESSSTTVTLTMKTRFSQREVKTLRWLPTGLFDLRDWLSTTTWPRGVPAISTHTSAPPDEPPHGGYNPRSSPDEPAAPATGADSLSPA